MSAKRYYITSTGPSDDCDAFAVEEYDHLRAGDHEWVKADDHRAEVERLRVRPNIDPNVLLYLIQRVDGDDLSRTPRSLMNVKHGEIMRQARAALGEE